MKKVDIYFDEVYVKENGRRGSGEAVNLIEFTLIYPREGVPSVTTIKKAKLKDNGKHNPEGRTYENSIVFRESIWAKCQLNIKVVAVDKPGAIEKFFGLLFKGVFSGLLGKTTAGISNVVIGKVVATLGGSIVDSFGNEQGENKITIGEYSYALDPSDLPVKKAFPLHVKNAVIYKEFDVLQKENVELTLLDTTENTGESNGHVKLRIIETQVQG